MPRKKKEQQGPPRKRGCPSDFKGARLTFMLPRLAGYIKASRGGKKSTKQFWRDFFFDYWREFPWRLPFDEDPVPGTVNNPETAEEAFKALDLDLSEAEAARKSKIQTDTKKHDDYKEGVQLAFIDKYPDVPNNKRVNLLCEVAREQLALEPEDVQEEMKKECQAAHQANLAAYEADTDQLPVMTEETRKYAREKFVATVNPLLSALQSFTGYTLNILAARVNGDEFEVESANAGTVGGKDWADWDPVKYNENVVPNFLRFVHASHLETVAGSVTGVTSVTAVTPLLENRAFSQLLTLPIPSTEGVDPTMPPTAPFAPLAAAEPGPPPPPALVNDDDNLMSGAVAIQAATLPAASPAVPTSPSTSAAATAPSTSAATTVTWVIKAMLASAPAPQEANNAAPTTPNPPNPPNPPAAPSPPNPPDATCSPSPSTESPHPCVTRSKAAKPLGPAPAKKRARRNLRSAGQQALLDAGDAADTPDVVMAPATDAEAATNDA
ncbi:hypothetical protein C8R43DRAFT_1117312 [Mycena crocata]|nr:hypothetical protein C8R43DRAFT_1117312 [Mycena crocata]